AGAPGHGLPGGVLGRGAARLAGRHAVAPGRRATLVATTEEGRATAGVLHDAGMEVRTVEGPVVRAEGRRGVRAVVVGTATGHERIECDTLVLSLGWAPRDAMLRMGTDQEVAGAGEVVIPGCSLEEAQASGRRAANGQRETPSEAPAVPLAVDGYVCLCEDVSLHDLEQAWDEGWRSSEILKRYTTATMGPCQGAVCGRHLAGFAEQKSGSTSAGARTTSRPPARPVRLDTLAAGIDEIVEKRTSLHDLHLELGAHLGWSGSWKRPFSYGDWPREYHAVREDVSVMDVGTLGKFLVAGRDA